MLYILTGYSACSQSCLREALAVSETGIVCCPSNYYCTPGGIGCVSTIPTTTIGTDAMATDHTYTLLPTVTVHATAIRVRYRSSDLANLRSAVYGTVTPDLPEGLLYPPSSTSGASSVPSQGSSTRSSRGSKGTQIAIGVTVPVVLNCPFLLVLFLYLQRKRRRRAAEEARKVLSELDATGPQWCNPRLVNSTIRRSTSWRRIHRAVSCMDVKRINCPT